jgi:AraC-like DNA-binding protein
MTTQPRSLNQGYWRHTDLPYLELRSTWSSRQPYQVHQHEQLSIGAIIEGQTCSIVAGTKVDVGQGECILIEPKMPHSCNPVADQPRSYHMLYVDKAWCLNYLSRLYGQHILRFTCPRRALSDPLLFERFLMLVASLHRGERREAREKGEALVTTFIERFCQPEAVACDMQSLTLAMKQKLLASLSEPPTLEQLSAALERRPETLIRAFQRDVGLTPKAFLNNARIEKSKQLLRAGLPIIDVAQELGFSDQSHFHKIFVALTAATPRQYQRLPSISDNNA